MTTLLPGILSNELKEFLRLPKKQKSIRVPHGNKSVNSSSVRNCRNPGVAN